MIKIFFVFVGEGSTDDGLVPHLEKLCILCGADEANGLAIDWHRASNRPAKKVLDKIKFALELEPGANLIFIHRDADEPNPEPRYQEIERALRKLRLGIPGIGVVPVQETEAWLLLDETEIRRVAENPMGRTILSLPAPTRVESMARPKELLFKTLLLASELSGRRREKFKKSLPYRRHLLLERLDPEGDIQQMAAWQRLRNDLQQAIDLLRRSADSKV